MSTFPAASYISNAARTEGEVKTALEDIIAAAKQIVGAGVADQALTIASGDVTPAGGASGILKIDTEAAAATDDLDHIVQTNVPDGSLVLVHNTNAARVVAVQHSAGGAGQISLQTGGDFVLADPSAHWLLLKRDGTTWVEIWRSPAAVIPEVLTKTGAYTTTVADRNKLIDGTSGTWTLTLLAAATAGKGFLQPVKNSGIGVITIDGNGAETIDGAATLLLHQGDEIWPICDGTGWKSVARFTGGQPVAGKTGAYTVVAADRGYLIDATANTWTLSLTAAATLGAGFAFAVRNSGTGKITIDPNGAETIDGAATLILYPGDAIRVVCDGSTFKSVGRTIKPGMVELVAPTAFPAANSVAITDIPQDFAALAIVIEGAICGTTDRRLYVDVSTDNGSSYDSTAANFTGHNIVAGAVSAVSVAVIHNPVNNQTNAQDTASVIVVHGYQSGPTKSIVTSGRYAGTSQFNNILRWFSTGGLNAIRIRWNDTGNFSAGTYAIYGVR